MINIASSLYYRAENNKKRNIDEFVQNFKVTKTINKLYSTMTFDILSLPIKQKHLLDEQRIYLKIKVDDSEIKEIPFIITNIELVNIDNRIVMGKTIGAKIGLEKAKSYYKETTLKSLLTAILKGLELNLSNLTDYNIPHGYESNGNTIEELVDELQAVTLFDYYFKDNVVFFEDRKVIAKNAIPVKKFSHLDGITQLSTSSSKDAHTINKLYINTKESPTIYAEPRIVLELTHDPMPISPQERIIVNKRDSKVAINPMNNKLKFYYSPLSETIESNLNLEKVIDYTIVEKYRLDSEQSLVLSAGVKSIIEITLNGNHIECNYKNGYNTLVFNEEVSGDIKISYFSDIYTHIILPQTRKTNILIEAQILNTKISHHLKVTNTSYYELPHSLVIDLITEWGISPSDAVNRIVTIDDINYQANPFGELTVTLYEYGEYELKTAGYPHQFITYNEQTCKVGTLDGSMLEPYDKIAIQSFGAYDYEVSHSIRADAVSVWQSLPATSHSMGNDNEFYQDRDTQFNYNQIAEYKSFELDSPEYKKALKSFGLKERDLLRDTTNFKRERRLEDIENNKLKEDSEYIDTIKNLIISIDKRKRFFVVFQIYNGNFFIALAIISNLSPSYNRYVEYSYKAIKEEKGFA